MENKRQTISRPLASHLRQQSMGASSSGASPVLLARINEKKQELANLKELQALSAGLADQMEVLEKKLSTLSDGTEAVAAVLSNWHNVLRAINMASSMFPPVRFACARALQEAVKIPKPKEAEDNEREQEVNADVPLPQTLVRIPTQHAAPLLQQASSGHTVE